MAGDETTPVQHGVLLGQWVRERRRALGLTGEQVAGRMGPDVPGNFIAQLETGGLKRMVGQPRLGQLARALGVAESVLLYEAGMLTDADPDPMPPASEVEEILAEFDPQTREGVLTMLRSFRRTFRHEREARSLPAPAESGAG